MTREEYKAAVRPFLSEKRFYHSECVAAEAEKLAKHYGADPETAWVAGILHDIMKELPPEEQLKKMDEFGIILTEMERGAQKLWHAVLGAVYVQKELSIADRDIVDPILYHTTPCRRKSCLWRIIFPLTGSLRAWRKCVRWLTRIWTRQCCWAAPKPSAI